MTPARHATLVSVCSMTAVAGCFVATFCDDTTERVIGLAACVGGLIALFLVGSRSEDA